MDPYKPPSEAADVASGERTAPRKPIRVSVLQALCAVQLIRTVFAVMDEFRAFGGLAEADGIWLVWNLAWFVGVIALVLALQRLLPRPQVVAPVLAGLWWANTVMLRVQEGSFVGASSSNGGAAGAIIAELVMLWLAASLVFHRKTRAYLGGVPNGDTQ